jgi:hypothetical protein
LHANDRKRLAQAEATLRSAIEIAPEPVTRPELILERLASG